MNNQLFFLILFAFFIQALSLQYLKNRKENSNILKTSDDKRAHLKALKSSKEVIDHKAISDQINSNPASTWKHKVYPQFVGKTKAELNSQFMGHTPPTDEERAKEVIHDAATSNQRKIQIGSGLFGTQLIAKLTINKKFLQVSHGVIGQQYVLQYSQLGIKVIVAIAGQSVQQK